MTKDEALRMALEALDFFEDTAICQADTDIATEAITAIKEALAQEQCKYPDCKCPIENPCLKGLAQPEQERPAPCARHCEATAFQITIKNLEAQLAQRTWVGMTHAEVDSWELPDCPTVFEFAQFIEAKLKQMNGYAEEKNT